MVTREIAFANDVLAGFGLSEANIHYRNKPSILLSGDYVCDWIERHFYIPEQQHTDNPALPLDPYQRAVIREAHRQNENGRYVYDLVLWSDIKKSAKSTIAAAVILCRAMHLSWGGIRIVANDLRQANSRVFFYIVRALELNKELRKRATIRNYKITLDNHTVIEAVPVDPSGEAGGNDDMVEWTEAHGLTSTAAIRMWSEMTIPPTKHGFAQRWLDTYAGWIGESPVLEQLYEICVKSGKRLDLTSFDAPDDLEVYANGSMLALWNTRPRLPWQSDSYYASEEQILPPNEFSRMHRNQWVTSENVFVPAEWWDACQGEYPEFDARLAVVVGMDAGVSSDYFALVGVSRINDITYARFCKVWKPPKGGKIDFADVERFIRDELLVSYNVVQIAYDPYQTHDLAMRLRGVVWCFEFTQGAPRLEADKQLFDCIRDRRIMHNGNVELTEGVKNANSKSEGDVDKLRIVKRAAHLKIDPCVALSMANSEARRLSL